jgi:hypothetical protein
LNREREQEEKANPEKRQRRLEDDDCKKINFFAGHTRATVSAGARATASAGADTVCVAVLDSEAVLETGAHASIYTQGVHFRWPTSRAISSDARYSVAQVFPR